MEVTMRGRGIIGAIVLVWLLIGVFAAWQRDYFKGHSTSCVTAGNIALTVVAGPLNYAGVNPKVKDCHVPQPSSMSSGLNLLTLRKVS
ncbi:hypothetical protein [Mycobacterium sp.]|uniref:hypothetical protein n=1 Tax=Mycobacterium sp. TaxID=1785 RepID=UPI003C76F198